MLNHSTQPKYTHLQSRATGPRYPHSTSKHEVQDLGSCGLPWQKCTCMRISVAALNKEPGTGRNRYPEVSRNQFGLVVLTCLPALGWSLCGTMTNFSLSLKRRLLCYQPRPTLRDPFAITTSIKPATTITFHCPPGLRLPLDSAVKSIDCPSIEIKTRFANFPGSDSLCLLPFPKPKLCRLFPLASSHLR